MGLKASQAAPTGPSLDMPQQIDWNMNREGWEHTRTILRRNSYSVNYAFTQVHRKRLRVSRR